LDALIVGGGDDHQKSAYKLQEEHPEFPFIGVAKTMDNDINLPEPDAFTYGFITFVDKATELLENGKQDAKAMQRVKVVGIFGRKTAHVALHAGANVEADRTLAPEEGPVDLEKLIQDMKATFDKKNYGLVVVSEGISIQRDYKNNAAILEKAFAKDPVAKVAFEKAESSPTRDSYGNPKLEHSQIIIAAVLKAGGLNADYADITSLVRSAPPSQQDWYSCDWMGEKAVQELLEGNKSRILYFHEGQIKSMPMAEDVGGRAFNMETHKDIYLKANQALLLAQDNGPAVSLKEQSKVALSEKLVVRYSEVGKNDVAIVGGKNANLGELIKIPEIAPMVPRFVAVTTKAFKVHMNKATTVYEGKIMSLKEFVEARLKKLEAAPQGYENSEELGKAGEDIRQAIEASEMPAELRKAIIDGYESLCKELGVEDMPVAVRSSATAEDTQDASFAGQQDTYLNMIGAEQVVNAVQRNWASLFTDRAIYYRHEQHIEHDTAYLSAVIQQMINSKTAGTAFTVDVGTGAKKIKIDASWGPGEVVVSGAATPDTWIVDKLKMYILRRDFGSKLVKFILKNEKNIKAKEGIQKVDTSYEERHQYCLTDKQVKTLAQATLFIEKHYGRYMDIEWAFDQAGNLKILQARPETRWNK